MSGLNATQRRQQGHQLAAVQRQTAMRLRHAESTTVTPSGLLVPAHALTPKPAAPPAVALDADGRRRIAFTPADQKVIDRALRLLKQVGLIPAFYCGTRPDGVEPCGEPLRPENRHQQDHGYGCRCTRIHFLEK